MQTEIMGAIVLNSVTDGGDGFHWGTHGRSVEFAFNHIAELLWDESAVVLLVDRLWRVGAGTPGFELLKDKTLERLRGKGAVDSLFIHTASVSVPSSETTELSLVMVSDAAFSPAQIRLLERWQAGMERLLKRLFYYEDILDGLNAIDEGVSLVDRDGVMVFANQSCFDITQTTPEVLMGVPIDKYTMEKPVLMSVLADGKSRIDFEYYLTFMGRTIHLINSAYPVYDEQHRIKGAIDVYRNIKRSRKLADDLAGYHAIYTFENLIGDSMKVKRAIREAMAFSNSDKSMLIQGESGVGKELFAQSVHNYSTRSDAPFVALNCANLPSELIDSELFGYEEGAFTGAKKQGKQGKFELARGGTIFLDEIGELPIQLQAKLLRVLETKEISRIGSNKKTRVDIRVIAATNQDLDGMVKEGRFRADLLYRLRVLHVIIPPLRERGSDIALLAEHFLKKICKDLNFSPKTISKEALDCMMHYPWPGNIRELENVMYRAAYLSLEDVISNAMLKQCGVNCAESRIEKSEDFQEVTRVLFLKTLTQNRGNKKKTAEQLGISRPTVYRLIKKYNVNI